MEFASSSSCAPGMLQQEVNNSFELKVKDMLVWSRQNWVDSGQFNSRIQKAINSLKYWSKILEAAVNDERLIISVFNDERDDVIELNAFIDAVVNIVPLSAVSGFFIAENRRYMGLDFFHKGYKNKVEHNLKTINGSNIINVSWVLNSNVVAARALHIPRGNDNDGKLKEFFEKYATVLSFEREKIKVRAGTYLAGSTVAARLKLLDNIKLTDIPHTFYIESLLVLIKIDGRQPLCLTCGILGHTRANCPTPRCAVCKSLKPKKHSCNPLFVDYASILKGNTVQMLREEEEINLQTEDVGKIVNISNKDGNACLIQSIFTESKEAASPVVLVHSNPAFIQGSNTTFAADVQEKMDLELMEGALKRKSELLKDDYGREESMELKLPAVAHHTRSYSRNEKSKPISLAENMFDLLEDQLQGNLSGDPP